MVIMWVPACVRNSVALRVTRLSGIWDTDPRETAWANSTPRDQTRHTVLGRGMFALVFPLSTAAQLDPATFQLTRNEGVLAGLFLFFVPFLLFACVAVCYALHRMAARSWPA
jgi:hypothetical protein